MFFLRGVNMLTFAHGMFTDLDRGRRQGNQTVVNGMLLMASEGFKSGAVPHIVFSEGWKQYGEQSHPDSLRALDHFNIEFKVSPQLEYLFRTNGLSTSYSTRPHFCGTTKSSNFC